MAKIIVTYFDVDDVEMQCTVNADDEAAALGVVLDSVDDIQLASPFAVWRQRTPKTMARGKKSRGKLISGPVVIEPELDDDESSAADEPIETLPLPETAVANAKQTIKQLSDKLGVDLQNA